MKKKYGHIYNQNSIQNFSYQKFKNIFKKEDKELVDKYNIYVINKYIEKNYQCTVSFLCIIKKILKKTKVKLFDLNKQELQLLEERVFSTKRHIKTLSTNFELRKGEDIRIKFLNSKIYQKMKNELILFSYGELLISNYRIILINNIKTQIFNWRDIKNINYDELGFSFCWRKKILLLVIHDSESLNNTMKNFMNKINY